jgi:hypothetical protein
VSSLWTPSGEHRPEERGPEPREPGARGPEATGAEPGTAFPAGEPTPEEIEEMLLARAELASVPVADIVANHAVGLWQLALLHMMPDPGVDGSRPAPRLVEAGLAIDALGALVDGLGARLAPHDEALREALSQLRLAYVQVSGGEGLPTS